MIVATFHAILMHTHTVEGPEQRPSKLTCHVDQPEPPRHPLRPSPDHEGESHSWVEMRPSEQHGPGEAHKKADWDK